MIRAIATERRDQTAREGGVDSNRFDLLARHLHLHATRRATVHNGLGLAAVSMLAAWRATEAACRQQGAICKKPANCCTDVCQKFGKKKKCWCKRLGEPCAKTANCCSVPFLFCERVGSERVCCLGDGDRCSANSQCCDPMTCDSGLCVQCHSVGEPCGEVDCCSDLTCDAGTCIDLDGEG